MLSKGRIAIAVLAAVAVATAAAITGGPSRHAEPAPLSPSALSN